ncbi:hypothetical protein YC2023_067094 [Brassica napus]
MEEMKEARQRRDRGNNEKEATKATTRNESDQARTTTVSPCGEGEDMTFRQRRELKSRRRQRRVAKHIPKMR